MIGGHLRLARAAAGLSLRDLAKKIDNLVTAQAIGKYERDEAMPGSRVLIALARALDVSEDYLVGDREVVLEKVEFRKKRIAGRKEEAQVEAKALHLLERYLLVEELLGLPSVEWDRPREAPYPAHALPEADRAAQSLRQHWGLGIDPIPNLVELLEERGIKVLVVDLAETIDGLTARARRVGREAAPVIVLNRRRAGERQRFTLAHELGHMTIQAGRGVDAEKAAHRFAGAFLMPVEALWAEIGKHRRQVGWSELFDLKRLFGASVQAITCRCKDLGIFGDGLYRRLFAEFSRRGWRSPPFPEPEAMPAEMPKRFERLCFRALAEGAVSGAKAAELLGMSVRRLNELMEEPPAADAAE